MSSPRLGPRRFASIGLFAVGVALVGLTGCGGASADVVLYCAVDSAHSEPIVRAFEEATGLRVRFQPDVELSKSVGHRRAIQEEASNPRCDVFWNNEVVQTVLLGDAGFLQPYDSPAAADIPEQFRDPERLWTGFGARARVLIVNTEAFPDPAHWPDSTHDFLDGALAGLACMARPLTGTTAAHGAVWIQDLGLPQMLAQLDAMRNNGVAFGDSNGRVMRLVRKGDHAFGFTDTDDVKKAIDDNFPVVQVVPDQAPGEMGLIVIPNTVSMVKGAPHPEAARKLIDYLLSHEVEEALAHGQSAQIPLRPQVPRPDDVINLSSWRLAPIDWPSVGRAYAEHVDALEAYFNK